MTERERLIELIKRAEKEFSLSNRPVLDIEEYVADYLLDNGVIVPFVKLGDVIEYEGILYQVDDIFLRRNRNTTDYSIWGKPFDEYTDYLQFYSDTDIRVLTKEEVEGELERRKG